MNRPNPFTLLVLLLLLTCPLLSKGKFYHSSDSLIEELWMRNYVEEQLHLPFEQYETLNESQKAQIFSIGGFFRDLWNFIAGESWGKYREPGRRRDGPYMVFQHENGALPEQVAQIRQKIIDKKEGYFELYAQLYKQASRPFATCTKADCPNPITAKQAAFVFIIGLKYLDLSPLNEVGINDLITPFTINTSERYDFRLKAENMLKNCDAPWLNTVFDWVPQPLVTTDASVLAAGLVWSELNSRSYELINYLAAFDMIRWQHKLDPSLGINYNSPTINDIAKHLKEEYVVPLYNRCTKVQYQVNHNNYSIISGSALGCAAVVLGEWGGAVLFDWDNWPNRWANVANYQIHDVMWSNPLIYVPFLQYPPGQLSAPGGTYGFAEGDHYFKITATALLPYMIAQYNYQNGVFTRAYRTYPLYTLGLLPSIHAKYMKTMMKDPDYDNLFRWYSNLSMPNGRTPCIDESWNNVMSNGILGVKKKTTNDNEYLQTYFSTNPSLLGLNLSVDLTADYLSAFPKVVEWGSIKSVQMLDGTTVLRNTQTLPNNKKANHFLMVMADNEIADNSTWHEQNDAGQLTLNVDNDYLLIDPAKWDTEDMGYSNEFSNNTPHSQFDRHNVIFHGSITDFSSPLSRSPIMPLTECFSTSLTGSFSNLLTGILEHENYTDTRQVALYKSPDYWYYVVNDRSIDVENEYSEIKFNGNSANGFSLINGKAQWHYNCSLDSGIGRWGLIAETAVTSTSASYNAIQYKHGVRESDGGRYLEQQGGGSWGYHFAYSVKNTNKKDISFITKLTPYRCNYANNMVTTLYNQDAYAMLKVSIGKANSTDSIRNYHAALHPSTDSMVYNGVVLDAHNGFLSWDDDTIFRNGYCLSYTGFRKAGITYGKVLMYQNKQVIKTTRSLNVYYELQSKFKYKGYVYADSAAQVTLYMGDLDYNYLMVAKDKYGNAIPHTHQSTNSNTYKYITFNVGAGLTEFTLELADPCLVSCFFPPTAMTIDTFFNFNHGTTETLGHHLDIVKDSGELHITDGSKMSICPSYYLFNRDSITMSSAEANRLEMFPLYAPEEDLPGGGSGITDVNYLARLSSKRSMIIVNDKSALILDSGSYTHVGVGASILIRKGGTLYLKKGATLEIGSESINGYGEFIAEQGAYICIEDSSDLHFFVTTPDTNNANIFFVPTNVNQSVNLNGIQSQFKSGGRFSGAVNCLPLCSLWYYLEDFGVNNPDFGTNSLGRPLARFNLPYDTLCGTPDTIIYIDASRSLNEVKYRIKATRVGLPDSVYFRQQIGSYGMLSNHEPVNIQSLGFNSGNILIELTVENSCGDTDYIAKLMHIPTGPASNFTLSSDTICSGYGTLIANGSSSSSGMTSIKHEWSVMLIDTSQYAIGDTNRVMYGQSWEIDSASVSAQFNFPGFRWIGGFKYLIGLKVYGNCDMEAQRWDTISVPFQVFITSNGLHSTNGNIGGEVNLIGFTTNPYDSFVWYPSNLLNNPHSLTTYTISTNDSTLYTLTAYKDGCSAIDSIWVKHTEFVNLGVDTVVCAGSELLLGNKLDPSLFIGLLAYIDYNRYSTIIEDIDNNVSNASIKLGLFLYEQNYHYFEGLKATSTAFTDLLTQLGYTFYSTPSYLEALTYYKSHTLTESLNYFKSEFWNNNGDLTNIIDNQITYYGGLTNFRTLTEGELMNMLNELLSYSSPLLTTSMWYKNNTHINTENDWMMIREQVSGTTTYTLLVDNSSVVEYDEITVYVDSVLTPLFSLGSLVDSVTVQFMNFTTGNSFNNTTKYLWYFGDGDSSSLVNPTHRFPVKDSSYTVCLKATNNCGSYQHCDTLPLGAIAQNGLGKRLDDNTNNLEPIATKQKVYKLSNKNILGNNIPNPFNGTSTIDYELRTSYNDAQIRIINHLGQLVKEINLHTIKGQIEVDASNWSSGLYYYTLWVDGSPVDHKIMSVK